MESITSLISFSFNKVSRISDDRFSGIWSNLYVPFSFWANDAANVLAWVSTFLPIPPLAGTTNAFDKPVFCLGKASTTSLIVLPPVKAIMQLSLIISFTYPAHALPRSFKIVGFSSTSPGTIITFLRCKSDFIWFSISDNPFISCIKSLRLLTISSPLLVTVMPGVFISINPCDLRKFISVRTILSPKFNWLAKILLPIGWL